MRNTLLRASSAAHRSGCDKPVVCLVQRAAAGCAAMFTARKKIQKEKNAEPTEFEESVAQVRRPPLLMACYCCALARVCSTENAAVPLFALAPVCTDLGDAQAEGSIRAKPFLPFSRCVAAQALFDLEATNAELKSDLRDLYIIKAEEIDGKSGRKAIIIHVRPASSSSAVKRPGNHGKQLSAAHLPPAASKTVAQSRRAESTGTGLRAQVPYRLLKNFHRVQQRLVRELEKKFSGKDVTLVANRRIMPKQGGGQSNARPRSRTLTAVRIASQEAGSSECGLCALW